VWIASIETDVLASIVGCQGIGIPDLELEDMAALARAGEPGVALENLCTQLFEYDCIVPDEMLNKIETLGRSMGLKEEYWTRLERVSK
jgi:hypothetical protein